MLPVRGVFCSSCGTRVRCGSCKAILDQGARFCVECGEASAVSVVVSEFGAEGMVKNLSLNCIRLEETHEGRSLEASLTDAAVSNIGISLGAFISGNRDIFDRDSTNRDVRNGGLSRGEVVDLVVDIENGSVIESEKTEKVDLRGDGTNQTSGLENVFSDQGGLLILIEPRLKANSRKDFVARLLCLFLLARSERGDQKVRRTNMNDLLKSCSVNDGNSATYITKATDFVHEGPDVSLSVPGRERARSFLSDVFNPEVKDSWDLASQRSRRTKGSSGTDDATLSASRKRRAISNDVATWSEKWKSSEFKISAHNILVDQKVEIKATFALWAITEVDVSATDISRSKISQFIQSAFDLNVNERTVQNALNKSSLVVKVHGTTFRITPAGSKRIVEMVKQHSN